MFCSSLVGHLPFFFRRGLAWLFYPKYIIGVMAIIFNPRGEVLLVRHQWREKFGWRLPGGLVEKKGGLKDNLAREIYEELGIRLKRLKLVEVKKAGRARRIDVFYLSLERKEPRCLSPREIRNFVFSLLINHLMIFFLDRRRLFFGPRSN